MFFATMHDHQHTVFMPSAHFSWSHMSCRSGSCISAPQAECKRLLAELLHVPALHTGSFRALQTNLQTQSSWLRGADAANGGQRDASGLSFSFDVQARHRSVVLHWRFQECMWPSTLCADVRSVWRTGVVLSEIRMSMHTAAGKVLRLQFSSQEWMQKWAHLILRRSQWSMLQMVGQAAQAALKMPSLKREQWMQRHPEP